VLKKKSFISRSMVGLVYGV